MTFPTGFVEESADDLHTATYAAGSKDSSPVTAARFTDDYTNVQTVNKTYSKVGFSFILGILSSLLAYLIGIPAGISMARKKDKLGDKIGTIYIIFSLAVPSLRTSSWLRLSADSSVCPQPSTLIKVHG